MGGLIKYLPMTYTMLLIGTLSLIAFPFMSGYYSKDIILEIAINQNIVTLWLKKEWTYWLGTFTVILTTIYSINTIMYVFLGTPSISSIKLINKIHEAPLNMSIALIILSILSIISGYYLNELFISTPIIIGKKTETYDILEILTDLDWTMLLPTILSLLLIVLSPWMSMTRKFVFGWIMYDQLGNIYNKIIKTILIFSWINFKTIDQGIIMLLGPNGISKRIKEISSKQMDSGFITNYIFQIISSIITLICFYHH